MPALIRVGHKGADLISPGNTLASFEAALQAGVDMIEFDVLPHEGRLVLAHDPRDAASRTPPTLEEGLDHFAGEAYAGVELDVDLKTTGYERRVVEALRERGLIERSLISSQHPESLVALREADPDVRRGLSVPRVRRDYTRNPVTLLPAYGVVRVWRAQLPRRAERAIRAGECEAIMANRLLFSKRLAERVHAAGGKVYVWTVDSDREIDRLERLGADGVITNDPRLFGDRV